MRFLNSSRHKDASIARTWLLILASALLLICFNLAQAQTSPGLERLKNYRFEASGITQLERFSPGLTIGTTLYGSANIGEMPENVKQQLLEAHQKGLRAFTLYVDWFTLEPEPGRFDFSELIANLDDMAEFGFSPVINLTLIDIDEFTLPADLLEDGQLAPGLRLNSVRFQNRLARLLDQLVPLLDERKVWFLGLGNEMDVLFESQPELLSDYVELVKFAEQYTQTLAPELATGVIVTGNAVLELRETWLALRGADILVGMNYAPIDTSDFTIRPADEILENFRLALSHFEGEPVLIQELTCPNALSMGGNQEWQSRCMDILFKEIQQRPEVRLASIFTLIDFDGELCSLVQDFFLGAEDSELPADLLERFAEYLCRMGVLEADGEPKPAWRVILSQLPEIATANRRAMLRERSLRPVRRLR